MTIDARQIDRTVCYDRVKLSCGWKAAKPPFLLVPSAPDNPRTAGVRFRKEGNAWVPMMFDFKHIPAEARKKQARGGGFLSRLGFGAKPGEPTGFLLDWVEAQRRFA